MADALILLGIACFAAGGHYARGRPLRWALRPLKIRRVLVGCALAVGLFFAGISYLGADMTVLFLARNELLIELAGSTGVAENIMRLQIGSALMRVPVMVASCAALAYALFKGRLLWLAVLFVIANLLVNNPVSTARFVVGTYTIAYMILFGLRFFHRRVGVVLAIWLPLLIAFVFPLLDVFRESLGGFSTDIDVLATFATKGDFDAFQMIMEAMRFVSEKGITWGNQMFGGFLFFVPRALWAGKPDPTGVLLGEWAMRENVNLAAPLWIELFIDGWWFAVALGMFAFGSLCRRLQNSLQAGTMNIAIIAVPLLAGYQIILLRGSFMVAMSFLLPILAFMVIFSARRRA